MSKIQNGEEESGGTHSEVHSFIFFGDAKEQKDLIIPAKANPHLDPILSYPILNAIATAFTMGGKKAPKQEELTLSK